MYILHNPHLKFLWQVTRWYDMKQVLTNTEETDIKQTMNTNHNTMMSLVIQTSYLDITSIYLSKLDRRQFEKFRN